MDHSFCGDVRGRATECRQRVPRSCPVAQVAVSNFRVRSAEPLTTYSYLGCFADDVKDRVLSGGFAKSDQVTVEVSSKQRPGRVFRCLSLFAIPRTFRVCKPKKMPRNDRTPARKKLGFKFTVGGVLTLSPPQTLSRVCVCKTRPAIDRGTVQSWALGLHIRV